MKCNRYEGLSELLNLKLENIESIFYIVEKKFIVNTVDGDVIKILEGEKIFKQLVDYFHIAYGLKKGQTYIVFSEQYI